MATDSALEALRSLLLDRVDRIDELVDALTDDLPTPIGTYRPDGEANTVCWLLWHQARVLDDHGADLAGTLQVWTDGGWYDELRLPFTKEATGYGQSADEVAQVVALAVPEMADLATVDLLQPDGTLLLEGASLRLQADIRWLELCERRWVERESR
mgnify:CR=1 FL=1